MCWTTTVSVCVCVCVCVYVHNHLKACRCNLCKGTKCPTVVTRYLRMYYLLVFPHADLNLLDWSRSNVLAIALGDTVYLWNAESGSVQQLCELPETSSYICSLAWGRAGDYLAFGTSSNEIYVWDVNRMKRLRSMKGHSQRVSALSWRQHLLTRYFKAHHCLVVIRVYSAPNVSE